MGGSPSNSQAKDCLSMDILLTFHKFLLFGTSISGVPSNVFEGFAIFARMTSKPLSKGLRTSKSTPTGLQNDSRSLPKRSQGGPESSQDRLKRSQDHPKRPYDRPKRSLWATLGLVWNACGWLFIKFSTKRLALDGYLAYFSYISASWNLHF